MRSYRGTYQVCGTNVIESADLRLVTEMLEKELTRITADPSSWRTLYLRKADKSYWLLSYEQPEMHGGGIKVLTEISQTEAERFVEEFGCPPGEDVHP